MPVIPALSADASELLRDLARQGQLTVRALRAWGQLPQPFVELALELHGIGIDLLDADAHRVGELAEQAQADPPVLPSRYAQDLKALEQLMLGYGFRLTCVEDPRPETGRAPTQAEPDRPAAEIAQAVIGPRGGVLELEGLKVNFPTGAVADDRQVHISRVQDAETDSPMFDVRVDGPPTLFAAPVELRFPAPHEDGDEHLAKIEIGPDVWLSMETRRDPETGEFIASTHHFSRVTLRKLGRDKSRYASLAPSGLTAAAILSYLGLGSSLVVGAPVAVGILIGGWVLAGAAYDNALAQGYVGPFRTDGFEIYWKPHTLPEPDGPFVGLLIDPLRGHFVSTTGDSRTRQTTIGPAGAVRDHIRYERNGQTYRVRPEDLLEIKVPLPIVGLGTELQLAHAWYRHLGLPVPGNTVVYVGDTAGRSPNGQNYGLWDGKILHLNAAELDPLPPSPPQLRATVAHEFWHVVSLHNGMHERWPGAEEAVATAMESLVWSSVEDRYQPMDAFHQLNDSAICTPFLKSGLVAVGAGESRDERGYGLWSWPKYLLATQSADDMLRWTYRDYLGSVDQTTFRAYAESLLIEEQALPDRVSVEGPFGTVSQTTGWPSLALFSNPQRLTTGVNTGVGYRLAAVGVFDVLIEGGPPEVGPSPIVVRRRSIDPADHWVEEDLVVGRPLPFKTEVGRLSRAEVRRGSFAVALPAQWDQGDMNTRVPLAVVTMPALTGHVTLHDVAHSEMPSELLIYRLSPPTDLSVVIVPAVTATNPNTSFKWTPPALGTNLRAEEVIAAYRIHARKADGETRLLAELAVDSAEAREKSWHKPQDAIRLPHGKNEVALSIDSNERNAYVEFGIQSVDGLMVEDGLALVSPIAWTRFEDRKDTEVRHGWPRLPTDTEIEAAVQVYLERHTYAKTVLEHRAMSASHDVIKYHLPGQLGQVVEGWATEVQGYGLQAWFALCDNATDNGLLERLNLIWVRKGQRFGGVSYPIGWQLVRGARLFQWARSCAEARSRRFDSGGGVKDWTAEALPRGAVRGWPTAPVDRVGVR